MKNKLKIKKIISFLLAICMMIQLIPQSAIQINADGVTEIDLSTATVNNIYLLTSDRFVMTENDGVETSQGEYRLTDTADTSTAKNVYVGDRTYQDQKYTGTKSIKVELKNVKNSLALLQINTISNGNYAANLNVSGASKIGKLDIQENADVNITLDADLEISEISMDTGSKLNVNTQGHKFKVTGTTQGSGDITFTGSNIDISGLKTKTLTLNNAQVTANDKKITATNQLTVKSSSIENASLLGYDEDETGEKTLSFEGNTNKLTGVAAVGTSASGKATVTIDGQDTITESSNTTYYCDYSLTYKYNDKTLTPEQTWPVSYRVKFQGSMADNDSTITGYHAQSGNYTTANTVILPEYTTEGYSYIGWKTTSSTNAVTTLPQNSKKNETLTATLKSDNVVVSFDLGYEPSQTTNDDYTTLDKVTTKNQEWGDTISLKTPSRFGYTFAGWKITSNSNGKTYNKDETDYTVVFSDAKKSKDGEYQITLEAQWEAKKFPLRFLISSEVETDKLQVKVGNDIYSSIADFTKTYKHVTWNESSKYLQFDDISYGETLKDYLKRMGLSDIPQLIDQRTGEQKVDFSGWSTPGGSIVDNDKTFEIGSVLDNKPEKETLAAYETEITRTPTLLTSQWGTASYTLTTDIADGWEILVDGKVQEASVLTKLQNALTGKNTMSIKVKAGSEVTWRCSSSDVQNFSLWNFTEGFLPVETTMTSGAKYISYTATMPYKDITATMSDAKEIYIDISQSPVTFEENVTLPSGRTADGFWYTNKMTSSESEDMLINAMTPAFQGTSENTGHEGEYFYVWNTKDGFHLTSNGNETTNQLSLVNAMTLSLKNCKMKATDAYNQDAVGSKLDGVELGDIFAQDYGSAIANNLKDKDLKKYANILLNTQKTNAYAVTLNIEDDNSEIMDISTDGFHPSNQYNGQVIIQGNNKEQKFKLGTFFGDFQLQMINLDATSYEKDSGNDPFDYTIYASNTGSNNILIRDCKVDIRKHNIYTFNRRVTINNTNLKVNNIKLYYEGVSITGTSNVHIYGDVYSARHTIAMSESASAVIDGNLISTSQDNYSYGTIDTSGYLIVKGTVFDTGNMTFKKGTIICNILEVGSKIEITDSSKVRIITNMITGNIHNKLKQQDGKWILSNDDGKNISTLDQVSKNEDDYPFITYSSNAQTAKTYKFGGSNANIYLYGYYNTNGKYYDTTIKATDKDNPISQWIEKCVDSEGELNDNISFTDDEIESSIAGNKNTANNECIALGNSTYTSQTEMPRQASFEGAKIYAAGNITMFNDTTVSGGQISCNGDFGTKGDLSITGGTLSAKTIGNVGDLTNSKEDMTKSWKKVSISDGTVNAGVIGARDSYANNKFKQRSYVNITGGTIKDSTKIRSDEYVNYIYSKEDFPDTVNKGVSLQDNLRMTNQWENGSLGSWKTEGISKIPVLKDKNGDEGNWIYGSISGSKVTAIDKNGQILPAADSEKHAYDSDQILLYAVRSKAMLTQVYGSDYYGISVDGNSNVGFTDADMTDISDQTMINVLQKEIQGGAKVTLTLTDSKYKDRTVVWYKDGNGQYHNALADSEWNGNSITFSMPNGSTYIYVVDENHQLPLDFKASSLSFTKDGFMTEYAQTDNDGNLSAKSKENVFTYAGDYKIVQSDIKDGDIRQNNNSKELTIATEKITSNRIRFVKDFDNTEDKNSQNIYLHHVYQKYDDSGFGVILEDGAKVKFQIDGMNGLFRFSVKENSKLILKGKTGQNKDYIYFNKSTTNSPDYYNTIIGNNDSNGKMGTTGECVMEDLNLVMRSNYAGTLIRGGENTSDQSGSLLIKDCTFDRNGWGDSNYIARNLDKITIDNSKLTIPNTSSGYTTAMFRDCGNVTLQNDSELSWTGLGSINTGGFPVDFGIDNFTVDNSKVTVNYDTRHTAGNYQLNEYSQLKAKNVILKNSAEFQIDSRALFNQLEVNSGSKLTVAQKYTEDTYLFSSDITVDGGKIDTDYLIVSGYYLPSNESSSNYYATSKAVLDNRIKSKTSMVDGNEHTGLVIKSGTVNVKKFAGGDMNGKISVTGGTLKAAQIGTSGYLYGFTRPLPANTTDYVYQYPILNYSNYTEKANVIISGGTVNVADHGYLGGMNSEVEIKGGEVVLGDQAVVGMTKDQTTMLTDYYSVKGDDIAKHTDVNCNVKINGGSVSEVEGDKGQISTPYGKINISNPETKVKITNMNSDYGSIEIKDAKTGYNNPYTGGEDGQYKSNNIGIWITDTLSAQTINISEGAQVYAENAYAQITNNEGALSVNEAALYSASYGEKGIVRDSADKKYNDNPSSNDQTVFGTKMVTVSYDLNPNGVILDSDLADIKNPNQENYTVTGDESTITLQDLESDGYEFKGWYRNKECSGDVVTNLKTKVPNDLTLYAKWEKVKVKFKIIMDSKSSTDVNASEFEGDTHWTKEGDTYVYKDQPEIIYGDKILSVNGVNLKDYSTNTLGVTEIAISEAGYAGDTYINAETIVTKQLAKYYKTKNEPIVLHINGVQKRYATVTFSLNKKDGKPSDAMFNGTIGVSPMERQENVGVDKNLGTISSFADSSVTDGKSKGLIQPSATGYTFIGWNTNADATKDTDTGWVDKDSIFKDNTRVYAIWQANTYRIAFDAGDGTWVTSENEAPAVNANAIQTLYYYWKYDTPISETKSFWIKEGTTDKYMSELPYAWKEGSTFDNAKGWTYTYSVNGQEFTDTVTSTEVLNTTFIKKLDTDKGSADSNPTTTALTLKASYTPVKVTYDLNNGKWKDSENTIETNPTYGAALYGYTQGNETDTENGSKVVSTVTGENNETYQVLSTTAEYYNTNKKYSAKDYRNQLSKKGYTFEGWEDEDGKLVGTTPRFRNVKLKAKWKANSYSLTLNSLKDNVDSSYSKFHTGTGASASPINNINVKVGEEINDSKWPDRNGDWYAYNQGTTGNLEDNQKRYLLGFTFATLDPGTTNESESPEGYKVYQKYAQTVTNLQNNSKSLFQSRVTTADSTTEGTVFGLPEDSTYTSDIGESSTNYSIPDYPDGSTINMYAVYRERSLVFVERYIDPNGNVQQKIKYSTAWNEYSDYPTTYGTSENTDITKDGYSLIGWYVNGFTRSSPKYPDNEASYKNSMNQFRQTAENLGTYDIMVYTVYVAQLTRSDITLTAKQDPTTDQLSTNSYVLPSSMQTGELSLRLNSKDAGFNIVSQDEMKKHEYDQTWTSNGKTYQSDDTAAIVVTIHKGDRTVTKDLSELVDADGNVSLNQQVEAGWQLTFTLYHSKVMTKQSTYKLEVQANFEGQGLEEQWIKNQIQVKLQPSMYKVNYKINLPEQAGNLTIDDSNADFTKPSDDKTEIIKEVSLAYGSTLSSKIPEIEGYKDSTQGWKYGASSDTYQKLDMTVSAANKGTIDLTKDYEAKTYTLAADDQTLKDWTITYTDGVTGVSETTLGNDAKKVSYHSKITFKPKDAKNPPEFITLTLGSGEEKKVKLSDYVTKQSDGSYTFVMPAEDVRASYVTEETMYLEEGTITIDDNGYTQVKATGTVTKSWPGNYIILQNKENSGKNPTKNRLIINGDQSSHKIEIGNLNINSTDSIQLGDNATATITMGDQKAVSALTVKNIKVPSTSSFTCKPEQPAEGEQSAIITLNPEKQVAAIGDVSGNGSITLDHLKIAAVMPAGSNASAIGSGKTAQTAGKDINITNSDLTVTEQSDTDTYNGVWIGGNSVGTVNIENAAINRGNDNNMGGPLITNAENVKIVSSKIGTSDQQIPDPIYAKSKLVIDSSEIYQIIQTRITGNSEGKAPIGTAETGASEITNSTINMMRAGGISEIADLYTGTIYIKDAVSDVTIDGTQIIDLSNGTINIKTTAYAQGNTDHKAKSVRRNYVLLEEGTKPQSSPDLVVSSIAANATIEVRKPSGKYGNQQDCVTAGDFQTAADTNLVLKGNLEISGKAEITDTSGKTVKVTADDNAAFRMSGTESVFADSKGTYTQSGGKLESNGTFGNKDLDITLNGVTATLQKSLHAKDLHVESSNVTAAGQVGSKPESTANASNVTNVKINKSRITASEIGALGEYDKTFTIVTADTASSLNGTIIKDEYRLAYDDNSAGLGTTNLSKVLRTSTVSATGSTTVQPINGVPGNPTDPNSLFSVWYVNEQDAGQTVRKALKTGSDTVPGLTHNTTLSASTPDKVITDDVKTNGDNTKTLTVHAWLNATGEVVIEKGRKFVTTTTKDQKTTTQANGAWTLQLTSSGTFIDGRDYQVTFGQALPQGTKLTLTIPKTAQSAGEYYYYDVDNSTTSSVKFSQFKKMGTNDTFKAKTYKADAIPDNETYLLSADFAQTDHKTTGENQVTLKLLPEKTSTQGIALGTAVSYDLSSVTKAVLNVESNKVTISTLPLDNDNLSNQQLYVKAVFTKNNSKVKLPYYITATLGDIKGKWISKDTVIFDLGAYGSVQEFSQNYKFEGLTPSDYKITWSLVYGAQDENNIAGNVISNKVE